MAKTRLKNRRWMLEDKLNLLKTLKFRQNTSNIICEIMCWNQYNKSKGKSPGNKFEINISTSDIHIAYLRKNWWTFQYQHISECHQPEIKFLGSQWLMVLGYWLLFYIYLVIMIHIYRKLLYLPFLCSIVFYKYLYWS